MLIRLKTLVIFLSKKHGPKHVPQNVSIFSIFLRFFLLSVVNIIINYTVKTTLRVNTHARTHSRSIIVYWCYLVHEYTGSRTLPDYPVGQKNKKCNTICVYRFMFFVYMCLSYYSSRLINYLNYRIEN